MTAAPASVRAGELRLSQVITQSGPGSLVDLPTLSMVIAGLDEWEIANAPRVDEPRLARFLKVDGFREPPFYRVQQRTGGVPARIFPRFLACPRCNRLALHSAFTFDAGKTEHLCKSPTCRGGGRGIAYPARFIVACPRGHLADFPWHFYVHEGQQCDEELAFEDTGRTGSITDLWVRCATHGKSKNLGRAFGEAGRKQLPRCFGERPWLGDQDPKGCGEDLRVILRGASNAYFSAVTSAISIPPWTDPVQTALGPYADLLANVETLDKFKLWLEISNAPELGKFNLDEVWGALQARRRGTDEVPDLKAEEWRAFHSAPAMTINAQAEFQARHLPTPSEASSYLARVVALDRLREVRVLRGFTRIDSVPDIGEMAEVEALKVGLAPLRRERANWLPGAEFRGEGFFLEFDDSKIVAWEARHPTEIAAKRLVDSERAWWASRDAHAPAARPIRYALLHTFAHLLIRQLALDCGYSSTSLRERIYSRTAPIPMAGVLVYTATPDSDGSLGGLVEMARPELLGSVLRRALTEASLCANDPLCADRALLTTSPQLNGAACHSCLLISETACESANHYLDRGLLVPTVARQDEAFVA
jgi:hypothetical protein